MKHALVSAAAIACLLLGAQLAPALPHPAPLPAPAPAAASPGPGCNLPGRCAGGGVPPAGAQRLRSAAVHAVHPATPPVRCFGRRMLL